LEAAGYHSWAEFADDPQSEASQAEKLAAVVEQVEKNGLAGYCKCTPISAKK
jgi:hypothetical protein